MIRACDGHRGHGEMGCGFSTSTWPSHECPMCGGQMIDTPAPASPASRRPVAAWYERSGSLWLRVDDYLAQVDPGGRWTLWLVTPNPGARWIARRSGIGVSAIVGAPITWSSEAAQLAAEDALRAVLVDAAAALGMRVVP